MWHEVAKLTIKNSHKKTVINGFDLSKARKYSVLLIDLMEISALQLLEDHISRTLCEMS